MTAKTSLLVTLLLIPALALPACGRKKDRDVTVVIYDADGKQVAQQ